MIESQDFKTIKVLNSKEKTIYVILHVFLEYGNLLLTMTNNISVIQNG